MPDYKLTDKRTGKSYKVTAPSEEAAYDAFELMMNPPQPPSEMMMNPETGQMMDTAAIAEAQSNQAGAMGTLADAGATAMSGVPFAGAYMDEAMGEAGGETPFEKQLLTKVARERLKQFEERNPWTAGGLKVAGGVSAALPLAGMGLPAAVGSKLPSTMLGKTALGVTAGVPAGAIEGAVTGYGEGTNDAERAQMAKRGGLLGGLTGGIVGAGAPLVQKGAEHAIRAAKNAKMLHNAAKDAGLRRDTVKTIMPALQVDEAFDGVGRDSIAKAGVDAMLVDAGPASRTLLDTAIQKAGPKAGEAQRRVNDRANRAGVKVNETLDDVLGAPEGINKAARDNAQSTSAARGQAFDAAYSTPINYGTGSGGEKILKVMDVIGKSEPEAMRKAIKKANAAMAESGRENQHIMADIADDGKVTFMKLPNVEQVHEVKRALQLIGREEVDKFGRKTDTGARAMRLAGRLRDAIVDATGGQQNSPYSLAMKLGGDKIAVDEAIDFGRKLPTRAITMEDARDFGVKPRPEEVGGLKKGLRQQIDEQMANVKQTRADKDLLAREGESAVKNLVNRSNMSKMTSVLGETDAERIRKGLKEADTAFELKGAVDRNSLTFARQNADNMINNRLNFGVIEKIRQGNPFQAIQESWRVFSGRSPEDMEKISEKVWGEIADAFTQAQGGDLRVALERLSTIADRSPQNAIAANSMAKLIAAAGVGAAPEGARQLDESMRGPR